MSVHPTVTICNLRSTVTNGCLGSTQESVLSVKCHRVSADQRDFCMFAFMHVSVLARVLQVEAREVNISCHSSGTILLVLFETDCLPDLEVTHQAKQAG